MIYKGVQRFSWKGIVLLTVIIAVLPLLLSSSFFISKATFAGIYTIIAVGLGLLMGFAGQISLGQAAFYGVGAYSTAVLTTTYGLNPWLTLIISITVPALIAYVLGHTMARLHGYYLAMATLAFGIIIHVLLVEGKSITKGASGLFGIPKIELFGFAFKQGISYYYLVWFFALLVIILSLNIIHSRIGRALRSIHDSEVASSASGVDTGRYKMQIFVISAMFAGLAGWLFAHMSYSISPGSFGLNGSILFLTMVVLGGATSVWGALLGAILISAISITVHTLGSHIAFITSDFEQVLYGFIMMLVVIFLPQGLYPALSSFIKRMYRKSQGGSQPAGFTKVKGDQNV
ncbi:branched-chain amino acid ABC transporter permease [Rossellomorea vietnamensis]|uniref:Branched-chain amino acid ABC transporter permease n=1 Tax=Rossellomorea vietnamensis TaxID=218284 RepID=A0A5D4M447_9BACI|nr:branched-chain amino acid ABC transporter permease [Rossellomorea vietnamensis]TYR96287.1 branched-chain amino acid ABC transporter permease [Rossellomorea vietnamensis]